MARKFSLKGGIHPPHSKKKTEHLTIEQFPAPQKVIIPLSQHIGAPAKPLVKKGDRVLTGQLIGESSGFVSAVVNSSVSEQYNLSARFHIHPENRLFQLRSKMMGSMKWLNFLITELA